MHLLVKHEDHVHCLAYSPNGKGIVSGGDRHNLMVWNVEAYSGEPLARIGREDDVAPVVAFLASDHAKRVARESLSIAGDYR